MYLKRLDIHGFKTFPQRTIFLFPPGITAVVGPNGSGKSNVADAVRWVLGEQSFANLRSKKTEELIFGGGKGRPPLGFADVSLTIDNSDRLLDLPFDEVTIGRRAYRTGENEYFVNRSRVRLRDLLDTVAPLGSSFTLINQGLVDAALALQPQDRQALLEDAAEIGPYQSKKAEAERRLRETETNMVRLSDLLQEQEPQLRALRRQARDAEAAGAVEAELQALLLRQYRVLWKAGGEALASAGVAEQRRAAELRLAQERRAEAAGALGARRGWARELRERLAGLREAEAELDQRIAVNLREAAVAEERRLGLQLRQDELLDREQALRETCAVGDAELMALRMAVERGEAALREQRAHEESRSRVLDDYLLTRRRLETELAAARSELGRRTTATSAVEGRRNQLAEQQAQHLREIEALRAEVARAESGVAAVQARLREAEAAGAEAGASMHSCDAALEGAQRSLAEARGDRERTGEALAVARRQAADLQARHATLGRLVGGWEGAFPGVKATMQWAAGAGHTDFRLVSSIITVPQELETAVEVALGSRLQHIVVDHWEAAEAAIAELKRRRAGRATFLPLDTLRPPRDRGQLGRVVERPGILGCAAQMIEYAPRYATVVDMLLGRTLIAADLGAARSALPALDGAALFVTLAGEQVAASGALTGGSTRGEAGALRREREFRELPRHIAAVEAEVTRLQMSIAAADAAVSESQARLRAAEVSQREARTRFERSRGALDSSRRELHRAEDVLTSARGRVARAVAQHAETISRIEQTATELEAAQAERDAAAEAVRAAERLAQQRLDEAAVEEQSWRVLREALAVAEVEQRGRVASYERRSDELKEAARELGGINQRVVRLAQELAAAEQDLHRLQSVADALAEEARQMAAKLEPAETELAEAETLALTLEAAERSATGAVLDLEREHADAMVELQRLRLEQQALEQRAEADGILLSDLTLEHANPPGAGDGEESSPQAARIEQLRNQLRRMGPVNALAPAEHAALAERHSFLEAQLADVRETIATLREAIRELDTFMDEQFHATFSGIAAEFSAAFTRLFGGGTARLTLVSSEDGSMKRRGVEIVAQPPGKRQLHLQLLSGGERALTAAALLVAILKHRPRPFCIMDEVDAALDEANIVRFREVLRDLAAGTQFIVVTHNRGTVEVADTLYGISMGEDGASRVLSLRLEGAEEPVEAVELTRP